MEANRSYGLQRGFGDRSQAFDVRTGFGKEIEVSGPSIDVPADN